MFQQLAGFNRILVSGPQRSGTRFCSQIIAEELGYRYVDEMDIDYNDVGKLNEKANGGGAVVQCPGLSHVLHLITRPSDIAVMMLRDIEDIERSQRRIHWNYADVEWKKCVDEWGNMPARCVAELKYVIWAQQKELIQHYQEIWYESLSAHRRWVDEEKRKHFGAYQTQ